MNGGPWYNTFLVTLYDVALFITDGVYNLSWYKDTTLCYTCNYSEAITTVIPTWNFLTVIDN